MPKVATTLTISRENLVKALVAKKTPRYAREEKWGPYSYEDVIYPQVRLAFPEYNRLYDTNEEFTNYFVRDLTRKDSLLVKTLGGKTIEKILLGETSESAGEEQISPAEAGAGQASESVPTEQAPITESSTMQGGLPTGPISTSQPRIIRNIPQAKPPGATETVPGLKTTPETGLDYEGKPTATTAKTTQPVRETPTGRSFQAPKIPAGVSNIAKNFGSRAGVFFQRNIGKFLTVGRIGTAVSAVIGGIAGSAFGGAGMFAGAIGGGILPSFIKSGGAGKFLARVGNGAINAGVGISNQVSRGGLSLAGPGKKFLIGGAIAAFLFLGVLVAAITPGGGSTTPIGQAAPLTPSSTGSLNYTLPIKDSSALPADIRAAIQRAFPKAQIQYWDQIIALSKNYGINPALTLALWVEETGASQTTVIRNGGGGVPNAQGLFSLGHLGCAPGEDQTIDESVRCLNNFITRNNFTNDQFAIFMARYSGGPASAPFSNNPDFVKNFKIWYDQLVPSGPAAAVAITLPTTAQPPAAVGFSLSCPVGTNPRLTCGTAANPVNQCGHGVAPKYNTICNPYYYVCVGDRYSEALYHAIDVVGSSEVKLPFINGNEAVTWTRAEANPIKIGGNAEWGYRVNYTTSYQGKQIYLDLTHLGSQINNSSTLRSGESVGTVFSGVGHLHAAISVDGRWVEPIQDAGMCSR